MGVGTNNFTSDKTEYETPQKLFEPLQKEFTLTLDVCANKQNAKCDNYFTLEDNALKKDWVGNCWMNPPFSRNLNKWVIRLWEESKKGGTKVCLIPVRSNTKWWNKVIHDAEIRFIIGEVNFNGHEKGLWLPMCILIFGEKAKVGQFSTVIYTS